MRSGWAGGGGVETEDGVGMVGTLRHSSPQQEHEGRTFLVLYQEFRQLNREGGRGWV